MAKTIDNNPNVGSSVSGGTDATAKEEKKYLGESKMTEQPTKKLTLQLKDGVVTTSKIADGAVTLDKTSGVIALVNKEKEEREAEDRNLLNRLRGDEQAILQRIKSITINNNPSTKKTPDRNGNVNIDIPNGGEMEEGLASSVNILSGTVSNLSDRVYELEFGGLVKYLLFIQNDTPWPIDVGEIPERAVWTTLDTSTFSYWDNSIVDWVGFIPTGQEIFFDAVNNKLCYYDASVYRLVDFAGGNSSSNDGGIIVPKAWLASTPSEPSLSEYDYGDYIVDVVERKLKILQEVSGEPQFVTVEPSEGQCWLVYYEEGQTLYYYGNDGENQTFLALTNENSNDGVKVNRVEISYHLAGSNMGIGVSVRTNDGSESEEGVIPYASTSLPGIMSVEDKKKLEAAYEKYTDDDFITMEDVMNIIDNGEFNISSSNPASQKSIAEYITKLYNSGIGRILVPNYCCKRSELPSFMAAGNVWYDTGVDDNQLKRITATGSERYASVGEAYIVCLKKTVEEDVKYEPVIYIQTSGVKSCAIDLLDNKTGSSENAVGFYAPVWRYSTTTTPVDIGSTYFNIDENKLYLQETSASYRNINTGTYILSQPGAVTEYYLFNADKGHLVSLSKVDASLSVTSVNPLQNRTVTSKLLNLDKWRGRLFVVDAWQSSAPSSYTVWFNPSSKALRVKSNVLDNSVDTFTGACILVRTTTDGPEYYFYNSTLTTNKLVRILDQFAADEIYDTIAERAEYEYVDNHVNNIIGKTIAVRLWSANNTVQDWADGQYWFNSNSHRLFLMHNDGSSEPIGQSGEVFILINPNNSYPYIWTVGNVPKMLLTSTQGNTYANNEDVQTWKSRIIPVKYFQTEEPSTPSHNDIWYNPDYSWLCRWDAVYSHDWEYDVVPELDADNAYLLLDLATNNLYAVSGEEPLGKYVPNAIEDVYVNDRKVSTSRDGKKVAEITIDTAFLQASTNKGEVIAPISDELYAQNDYSVGDYYLDSSNILKKYVYDESTEQSSWEDVPYGSFLLRMPVEDSQTHDVHEYLFLYTKALDPNEQTSPIQLATYEDVTNASGGAVTNIKKYGETTPLTKQSDGTVELPNFITGDVLAGYVQVSQMTSLTNRVANLENKSENSIKAVRVESGGEVNSASATYSNQNGDEVGLVIPSSGSLEGKLLLRVIRNGSTTYYSNWNYMEPSILPTSYYKPPYDLYYAIDNEGIKFWRWNGTKLSPIDDIYGLFREFKQDMENTLNSSPIAINLSGFYENGDTPPTWSSLQSGKWYVYHNDGDPRLVKTNGTNSPDEVDSGSLYIFHYNDRLYAYSASNTSDNNTLITFPSYADFVDFKNSIHDGILIPKYWGNDSSGYSGWEAGDVWYDEGVEGTRTPSIQIRNSSNNGFIPYETNAPSVILYDNGEENKLYAFNPVSGDLTAISSSSSGGSGSNPDPENSEGSNVVLVKYWQSITPDGAGDGDYWYDGDNLYIYDNGFDISNPVQNIDENCLFINVNDNVIYRWDADEGKMVGLSVGTTSDEDLNAILKNLADTLILQSERLEELEDSLSYASLDSVIADIKKLKGHMFGYGDVESYAEPPREGDVGDVILVDGQYMECTVADKHPVISIECCASKKTTDSFDIPLVINPLDNGDITESITIKINGKATYSEEAEDICDQIVQQGYTRLTDRYDVYKSSNLQKYRGCVCVYGRPNGYYYVMVVPHKYGNLAVNSSNQTVKGYFYIKGSNRFVPNMVQDGSTDNPYILSIVGSSNTSLSYGSRTGTRATYASLDTYDGTPLIEQE